MQIQTTYGVIKNEYYKRWEPKEREKIVSSQISVTEGYNGSLTFPLHRSAYQENDICGLVGTGTALRTD